MKQLDKTQAQTYWEGFKGGAWQEEINVRDFIQQNLHQYDGDESFLAGPTEATTVLNNQVLNLKKQERENGGVLDADNNVVATITSHGPGYLNKDLEKKSSVCKPTRRSSGPSCRLGAFAWPKTR